MRSWLPFPDMRTISLGIGQLRDLMAWMGRAAMICQHQPAAPTSPSRTRSTRTSRPCRRGATTMRTARSASWSPLANGPDGI
jgi:hypothetical protein